MLNNFYKMSLKIIILTLVAMTLFSLYQRMEHISQNEQNESKTDSSLSCNWLIKPQYQSALPFSEGLAVVSTSKKKLVINKKGEIVYSTKYHYPQESKNGEFVVIKKSLLLLLTGMGQTKNVVKKNKYYNKEKSEPIVYPNLIPFEENEKGCGYKDSTGNIIVQPGTYSGCFKFYEGMAMVFVKKGDNINVGFIDHKGDLVITPRDWQTSDIGFSNGLCKVLNRTDGTEGYDKWGYIDKTGRLVIPYVFDYAEDFTEDCACVQYNLNWGYIQKPKID
jgi:hypothetical protein